MQISFALKESIYDCKIQITDSMGSRYHLISAPDDNETTYPCINVEIHGNEFDLTLIPLMPDTNPILNEFEENKWKHKLAKKATKLLFSSVDKIFLRVGCSYHINDMQDGDRLDIALQWYAFGAFDRFDLLEIIPMTYAFFEVSNFNNFFKLKDAYETNRKDVLKFAKTFGLADILGNGLLLTLFIYPIQVSRIKRLIKNKKIRKTLIKFNNLNDEERKRFLDKQERFLDRYR